MDIQIFPTENATQTIQKAIDELFSIGGGRVVIHKGEYQISSLLLRSDVTLYLKAGACLKGSRLPDDYDISDRLSPESGEDYTDAQNCPIARTGRGWIKPSGSTNPFSRWSRAMIKAYRAKNIAIIGEQGAVFDGQNCYDEKSKLCDFYITLFKKEKDGRYSRFDEEQTERMYTISSLKKILAKTGFEFIGAYSDFDFCEGSDSDERIYIVARCKK